MKRQLVIGLFSIGLLFSAAAAEKAEQIRTAVKQHQEGVVMVRAVLDASVSFRGQDQTQEVRIELPGVVLNAEGLIVMPNPQDVIGGGRGMSVEVNEVKDLRVVMQDGKEADADTELRDSDLGLMYIRLKKPEEAKVKPVDLAVAAQVEIGDPILILRRLSAARPDLVCDHTRVNAVLTSPRRMYLLSDGNTVGTLVLTLKGELVGIASRVEETDAEGNTVQLNVVLPAKQIKESVDASQGGMKKEEKKEEAESEK